MAQVGSPRHFSGNEMSDEKEDLALKLDAERRREIDTVRDRMTEFLTSQIEIQHKIDTVTTLQNALKERFEEGVSKRLTGLDQKFDKFMMEWGQKKTEDEHRDKRIEIAEKLADSATRKFDNLNKGISWVVLAGLLVVLVKYLISGTP